MKRRRQRRPTGPSACMRTRRVNARCDTCGDRPEWVHSPLFRKGLFCPSHCPECGGQPAAPKPEAQRELFEVKA